MASSSSSSPSVSVFSSRLWKYHVFLSFRGEDTRKTFVDHLYTALVQKGIYTYKDDETLPRGESVGSSLMKAIEESQIAVIVFSKTYAYSSWCLDELEYIMKCKDSRGQIVMPIFYEVCPSDVRKRKWKYGKTFSNHESENNNKIESWRKALLDASNISGWETKHVANGHESKCIKEIVDTISRRLHPVTSSVNDNLIGVEARVQYLISKLHVGFGGKLMIGIWGVGGGGKTTLASSIYDEISRKFECCCFVNNIREISSNKKGLEKLQTEILSSVLKQKQERVGRVEEGRRMLKDRLHQRKVLLVLDDVDNHDHLDELAGSRDWFGEGSRIIITTRDEHVLTAHKVDVIHNITLLNDDEAMKLFCKHAPRGHRPIEDYECVSKDVVSYAGGLPLALRILGRFLCDKEMNEWRSTLARLKEIPDDKILEKLKISFDGLKLVEKELFLDIACFFRRRYWRNIRGMMILDACGFYPIIGVKVLIQKALITISDGTFEMHDLVQEMAHYIVRGEHPKNPEKYSRVWKNEDVLRICDMDATTNLDKIEAITYQCHGSHESQPFLQTVANMTKLRWIDLNIEVLDWSIIVDTTHPLPVNFPPRELCCLTMDGLMATQLWEGYKYLPNLRIINLDRMRNLMTTPDFDGLPNLETFIIDGSPYLFEIHPSFGHLEKLICVVIEECRNLRMLPFITRSKKLDTLTLSWCTELFKSSKVLQNIENLEHIQEPSLTHSNLNHIGLRFSNGCLRKLNLSRCLLGDEDISCAIGWELPNLQELNLESNDITRLNFSVLRLPRLKCLNVSSCKDLVELSELPASIAIVIADHCVSLESFGDISNCKWLWKVSLWGDSRLGPFCGDILLNSMIEENAKYYFISINLTHVDIWLGFVLWLNWVKTYNMQLPHDWYTEYCGLLMFFKSNAGNHNVNIVIKQGIDQDFQCGLRQDSNGTLESPFHETFVGYVSFSSLRHTGCLNSTYNIISFSLSDEDLWLDGPERRFRAVLIPKDDSLQTTEVATDYSEFWDEEVDNRKTFTIQNDSDSSVKILWKPLGHSNRSLNYSRLPTSRPQRFPLHYYR